LIVHEWRIPDPIVHVRILRNRNFAVPTILLVLMTFTSYGMTILNPIFLQELLGYTAWKAGLAMAPRGAGVMAAMFLLGGIAKKGYDTRPLVGLGFGLIGISAWLLGGLDLTMSMSNFIWPTVVQGVGMGLVFPNLSASALSSIPREQMGYAASIYSMTRNVGGSIGTSVLTTLLVRREQVNQSRLVEHVSPFNAWNLHSFGGLNFNYLNQLITGQKQGLAMLYGSVQSQATMLSLNNIYRTLSVVMMLAILLCFLLQRPRAGQAPVEAH
jgi:DHA2 family multidrug resistance protein